MVTSAQKEALAGIIAQARTEMVWLEGEDGYVQVLWIGKSGGRHKGWISPNGNLKLGSEKK